MSPGSVTAEGYQVGKRDYLALVVHNARAHAGEVLVGPLNYIAIIVVM